MTIFTNTDIDPNGTGTWGVRGELFGQTTTVFTGTIFECGAFVAENV